MLSMNRLKVNKYVPSSVIKTEPLADKYTVGDNIGRGKFAVVRKCVHNETKEVVAAKFIRKRRKGKSAREEILREVVMLEMVMTHPRLVNLLEVYETASELVLITEYCEGGELFHECVIEESFKEEDVIRLVIQILEGLVFLHEQNIVHLDLKPQNILLTKPFPYGSIKICDLGFACLVHTGEDIRDIIGTADYVAPEVLDYEPLNIQTDMWSMGVLTYVMLTAYSPFVGENQQETFCNISTVTFDFPDELFSDKSQNCQDFITRLLVKNAKKRLTARQCLEHPWLKSYVIQSNLPLSVSNSNETITNDIVSESNENIQENMPTELSGAPASEKLCENQHCDKNFISCNNHSNGINELSDMTRNVKVMPVSEEKLSADNVDIKKSVGHSEKSCDIVSIEVDENISNSKNVNSNQIDENRKNVDKSVSKVTYSVNKMIVLKPTVPPRIKPTVPPHIKPTVPPQIKLTVPPHIKPTVPPHIKPTVPPHIKLTVPPHIKPTVPPRIKPTVPPRIKPTVPPQIKLKPSSLTNIVTEQSEINQFSQTFEQKTELSSPTGDEKTFSTCVNGEEKSTTKTSTQFILNPFSGNDIKIVCTSKSQRNSLPSRVGSECIKNKDKDDSFKRRSLEIPVKRRKNENGDFEKLMSSNKNEFNCVEEVTDK